jgi:hypothetical protein
MPSLPPLPICWLAYRLAVVSFAASTVVHLFQSTIEQNIAASAILELLVNGRTAQSFLSRGLQFRVWRRILNHRELTHSSGLARNQCRTASPKFPELMVDTYCQH